MQSKLQSEKPPLYFVPTAILCSCGQRIMIMEENHITPDLYLIVTCTQPWCSQRGVDKKIDLKNFAFREYEVL